MMQYFTELYLRASLITQLKTVCFLQWIIYSLSLFFKFYFYLSVLNFIFQFQFTFNTVCMFWVCSIMANHILYTVISWYFYVVPYRVITTLLTLLPMLYSTFLWLFCNYQLVLFSPFTFFIWHHHPSAFFSL